MIPSWYLALQNICGEQLASNNADADTATHSGSHADGDAGVDADPTVCDLILHTWDLAMERGNPLQTLSR